MGKPARSVGAVSPETPHSQLATEVERCCGYATEILAVSEEARALLVEERYHARRLFPLEGQSDDGFLESQLLSRNKLRMIYTLATELQKSLPLLVALAGTLNQTGSPCQCATHKGKSLG